MKKLSIVSLIMLGHIWLIGQSLTGTVINSETLTPMDFVSIGVLGKDVGTVSDVDGTYSLKIGSEYDDEILRFSYIGFENFDIKVKDFKCSSDHDVQLLPMVYELTEVVVTPNILGKKTLGHTGNTKMTIAGFGEYKLGFEHAVRMKLGKKEKAIIEKININIARCSFDSLHYRVNVYSIEGRKKIKNIS